MAPVVRTPSNPKAGRPKQRKPKTCYRCKTTFSSHTKLKNHLLRKRGCGPKAVALQKAKQKEASRQSTKVYSIKRELDKVGLWEFDDNKDEDKSMGESADEDLKRAARWVPFNDNLAAAKSLAQLDWTQVIDLR
ncbi:hypothetical protein F442_21796 [Phytophthora nicotianae P10297]|uniref:C2H2-type domain-containing protein n=1 Tax=Phytophthora nicotianae P10297 TaxID=1317064 RepID=W2Y486_PHYNI|nr:hypothetical protein F442_21796 [Phytophthora nicotianae P10297]